MEGKATQQKSAKRFLEVDADRTTVPLDQRGDSFPDEMSAQDDEASDDDLIPISHDHAPYFPSRTAADNERDQVFNRIWYIFFNQFIIRAEDPV